MSASSTSQPIKESKCGQSSEVPPPPAELPAPSKTVMCQKWMWGTCRSSASKCQYAHGLRQLKSTSFTKTSYCRSWLRGSCKLGDRCRHAHGADQLNTGLPRPAPSVGAAEDVLGDESDLDATSSGEVSRSNSGDSVDARQAPNQVSDTLIGVLQPMYITYGSSTRVSADPSLKFVQSNAGFQDFNHRQHQIPVDDRRHSRMARVGAQLRAASACVEELDWKLEPAASVCAKYEPLRLVASKNPSKEVPSSCKQDPHDGGVIKSLLAGHRLPRSRSNSPSFLPTLQTIAETGEHGLKEEM